MNSKQLEIHEPVVETEDGFFKEYNETLIRKLEDKMMKLQRSNKRLASLYQASCNLHTMKPSTELINIVLKDIIETAGYQEVNYFHFDENQNSLSFLAGIGFSDKTPGELQGKAYF